MMKLFPSFKLKTKYFYPETPQVHALLKRASKGTKEEEATWRAYDVTDHRTTKTTTSQKKNGGRGGLSRLSFFTPPLYQDTHRS